MAKQKGAIRLSGKTGDIVFSTGKYGARAGVAPVLTQKQQKENAERPQNLRTGILSRLASGILHATKYHADLLVPGEFFNNMMSLFRKEPTNHRVLLLDKLREMEVNVKYPFIKLSPMPKLELKVAKNFYELELEITHMANALKGINSFYLDFVLYAWNGEDDYCRHAEMSTAWMRITEAAPKYCSLKFDRKTADTEFLLACRGVGGINFVENGWTTSAMKFLGSGTLTAEGQKIVAERKAANEAAKNAPPQKQEVKPKNRVEMRDKK